MSERKVGPSQKNPFIVSVGQTSNDMSWHVVQVTFRLPRRLTCPPWSTVASQTLSECVRDHPEWAADIQQQARELLEQLHATNQVVGQNVDDETFGVRRDAGDRLHVKLRVPPRQLSARTARRWKTRNVHDWECLLTEMDVWLTFARNGQPLPSILQPQTHDVTTWVVTTVCVNL